jgi:peptide deformylase
MIRPILYIGTPSLFETSTPIEDHEFDSPWLHALIQDMVDTMRDSGGVGLAAPQIGVNRQVVTIEYADDTSVPSNSLGKQGLTVIINPIIEALGNHTDVFMEGCLSVPGLRGEVHRPTHIRYHYMDAQKQEYSGESQDFFARVMQHECDHLDGILYPMRMKDLRTLRRVDIDRSSSEKNPPPHDKA